MVTASEQPSVLQQSTGAGNQNRRPPVYAPAAVRISLHQNFWKSGATPPQNTSAPRSSTWRLRTDTPRQKGISETIFFLCMPSTSAHTADDSYKYPPARVPSESYNNILVLLSAYLNKRLIISLEPLEQRTQVDRSYKYPPAGVPRESYNSILVLFAPYLIAASS